MLSEVEASLNDNSISTPLNVTQLSNFRQPPNL